MLVITTKRHIWDVEAAGSNPATPTDTTKALFIEK